MFDCSKTRLQEPAQQISILTETASRLRPATNKSAWHPQLSVTNPGTQTLSMMFSWTTMANAWQPAPQTGPSSCLRLWESTCSQSLTSMAMKDLSGRCSLPVYCCKPWPHTVLLQNLPKLSYGCAGGLGPSKVWWPACFLLIRPQGHSLEATARRELGSGELRQHLHSQAFAGGLLL